MKEFVQNAFERAITRDGLNQLLPLRTVEDKTIRVNWFDGAAKVEGIVKPGMPNLAEKATSFVMEPAYFRRGTSVRSNTAKELKEESVKLLVDYAALFFQVLRVQLLTGGINLTDPETEVNVTAPSGIRESNTLYYRGLGGFREALNKAEYMVGPGEGYWTLVGNPVTLGMVPKLNNIRNVIEVQTLYDELVGNIMTRRFLWSPDIFTLVYTPVDCEEVVGGTYITRGENPEQEPSIWIRQMEHNPRYPASSPTAGPNPPARMDQPDEDHIAYQVGVAGLPALSRPQNVFVVKPAN